ncbi:MAG: MBL fold metallo-hydrolase [Myxococcales bacterium]|nr:MBL fold metallo-hydrolase [Myxococcales bacterium]
MGSIPYVRDMKFEYGVLEPVTDSVRRLVCENPGPFTFYGTNTYVIGRGRVVVVDPGPAIEAHVDALLAGLGKETIERVVVTHTHRDHSPAAAALVAKLGVPTAGHGPHGAGLYERGAEVEAGADLAFHPDEALQDGDVIEGDGYSLEVVHTPGHCSNHLCYQVRGERTLLTGDHVMGWSTSVISPPDGDMGAYMASLERLLSRDDTRYLPAHGAPIEQPAHFVKAYIEHRREREDQIRACLEQGIDTIDAMVPRMYRGVAKVLHPAAARSVLAHALHMRDRGELTCAGEPSIHVAWRRA